MSAQLPAPSAITSGLAPAFPLLFCMTEAASRMRRLLFLKCSLQKRAVLSRWDCRARSAPSTSNRSSLASLVVVRARQEAGPVALDCLGRETQPMGVGIDLQVCRQVQDLQAGVDPVVLSAVLVVEEGGDPLQDAGLALLLAQQPPDLRGLLPRELRERIAGRPARRPEE